MCKFVSPSQDPGHVNYEEMIKYLAKCIGEKNSNNDRGYQPEPQYRTSNSNQMYDSTFLKSIYKITIKIAPY